MGIIRLLLAIAVFNSHFPLLADLPIVDGHEAVLAFFAVSGFYMALILDTSHASPKAFYAGRFLSLYPIYLFALAVSVGLLVTWDIHPLTGMIKMRQLLSDPAALLVMLWTSTCVLGQELLFCLGLSPDGGLHFVEASRNAIWGNAPLIQAWSLSLEMMFYALAPFLVRLKSTTLSGLILASLALKLAIMNSTVAEVVFFRRFFLAEFWLFGCGILAYRLYKRQPAGARFSDALFFAALIGAIGSADLVPDAAEPFVMPAAALLALPPVFRLFRHSRLDRFVGKISYPFYLLHYSFIAVFETFWDEPEGGHILVLTLSAALLTHAIFAPGIVLLKSKMHAMKQPLFESRAAATDPLSTL